MTTMRFPAMTKKNRIKDLFGAVLLVLTALLYFEEGARAHVPDAGEAERVVVAAEW